MLIVRYLIALVFSIFMMATSLRIEERWRRTNGYKISTPDRLVIQMDHGKKRPAKELQRKRLVI